MTMPTTANGQHQSPLKQYLFQPFELIAGWRSLLLGIIVLLLTGGLAYLANVRFDGVMDFHMATEGETGFEVFLVEQLINWLSLSLVLLVFGLLFTKLFRVVDLLGTQALARVPMLLVALVSLVLPFGDVIQFIMHTVLGQGAPVSVSTVDFILFGIFLFILLFMVIWMIYLMYHSFSVACNLSGPKAVILFIIGLLAAEALSKTLIYYIV